MKKLMIAAAIVCAAAMSQAATTNWKWSNGTSVLKDGYTGKGSSSAIMKEATVYLFATTATLNTDKTFQTAMLKNLQDGTTKISDLAGLSVAQGKTDTNGQILESSPVKFDMTDVSVASTKYYYEIVVSGDNQFVYISGLAGAVAQESPKEAGFNTSFGASTQLRDTTMKATYNNAGWYQIASVPEPTSGLLLLLGVAGLALRRRRA